MDEKEFKFPETVRERVEQYTGRKLPPPDPEARERLRAAIDELNRRKKLYGSFRDPNMPDEEQNQDDGWDLM